MEFKEFSNIEENNYDVNSSVGYSTSTKENHNDFDDFTSLWLDAGMPEMEELEEFGITPFEFMNPDKTTIEKLQNYIDRSLQKHM